jgi:WD40 repeat protein
LALKRSVSNKVYASDDTIPQRKIAQQPFRVLDAPNLCDDFYLNLVDWSPANQLAVALGNSVYIWNANTASVAELANLGDLN